MVNEHTGELTADGFGEQRCTHGGVHAAGKCKQNLAVTYLLTKPGNCGFAVAVHVPIACAPADLEQEVVQYLCAELGVRDLRVELNAVEPALIVAHCSARAVIGRSGYAEALGRGLYIVGMAHPADAILGHAVKQHAFLRVERYLAVLADASGGADLAASHPRHELASVADAQNGNAGGKYRRIKMRRSFVVHAVRPAGEDDAGVAGSLYLVKGDAVVALDLCENFVLTHSAGDKLIILPAEIQYQNFVHLTTCRQ